MSIRPQLCPLFASLLSYYASRPPQRPPGPCGTTFRIRSAVPASSVPRHWHEQLGSASESGASRRRSRKTTWVPSQCTSTLPSDRFHARPVMPSIVPFFTQLRAEGCSHVCSTMLDVFLFSHSTLRHRCLGWRRHTCHGSIPPAPCPRRRCARRRRRRKVCATTTSKMARTRFSFMDKKGGVLSLAMTVLYGSVDGAEPARRSGGSTSVTRCRRAATCGRGLLALDVRLQRAQRRVGAQLVCAAY